MTTNWNECLNPKCYIVIPVQMSNARGFGCEIKLDPVSSPYCSYQCTPSDSTWKKITKCRTCRKILDDDDEGRFCTNCWEVETRVHDYLKSDNGMQFMKDYVRCVESDPLWINSDKRGIK
jgi:hypothetical protein